jgi:DNA invertase Pin-like site-specific DNA recombinase
MRASLIRSSIQAVLGDALRGRFEVVLAEALDRISRDQGTLPASSSAWRLLT